MGLTELISITVEPNFKLSKNSELEVIESTAASSVSIVITKSLSLTTSPIVFEISAPNSFNGSAFSIDRLNAFNLNPDFNIFFAIGRPIRPVPINPIVIMV